MQVRIPKSVSGWWDERITNLTSRGVKLWLDQGREYTSSMLRGVAWQFPVEYMGRELVGTALFKRGRRGTYEAVLTLREGEQNRLVSWQCNWPYRRGDEEVDLLADLAFGILEDPE